MKPGDLFKTFQDLSLFRNECGYHCDDTVTSEELIGVVLATGYDKREQMEMLLTLSSVGVWWVIEELVETLKI